MNSAGMSAYSLKTGHVCVYWTQWEHDIGHHICALSDLMNQQHFTLHTLQKHETAFMQPEGHSEISLSDSNSMMQTPVIDINMTALQSVHCIYKYAMPSCTQAQCATSHQSQKDQKHVLDSTAAEIMLSAASHGCVEMLQAAVQILNALPETASLQQYLTLCIVHAGQC